MVFHAINIHYMVKIVNNSALSTIGKLVDLDLQLNLTYMLITPLEFNLRNKSSSLRYSVLTIYIKFQYNLLAIAYFQVFWCTWIS